MIPSLHYMIIIHCNIPPLTHHFLSLSVYIPCAHYSIVMFYIQLSFNSTIIISLSLFFDVLYTYPISSCLLVKTIIIGNLTSKQCFAAIEHIVHPQKCMLAYACCKVDTQGLTQANNNNGSADSVNIALTPTNCCL